MSDDNKSNSINYQPLSQWVSGCLLYIEVLLNNFLIYLWGVRRMSKSICTTLFFIFLKSIYSWLNIIKTKKILIRVYFPKHFVQCCLIFENIGNTSDLISNFQCLSLVFNTSHCRMNVIIIFIKNILTGYVEAQILDVHTLFIIKIYNINHFVLIKHNIWTVTSI